VSWMTRRAMSARPSHKEAEPAAAAAGEPAVAIPDSLWSDFEAMAQQKSEREKVGPARYRSPRHRVPFKSTE